MSRQKKQSAGLLLYRRVATGVEILLVHPGGPYWARKDEGAWSIPKGEFSDDEDPFAAAIRECEEELGQRPAFEELEPLEPVKLTSGKRLFAWAGRGDFDPAGLKSNLFSMEWPPGSGRQQQFPEVDRAGWFDLETARRKLTSGQLPLVDQLQERLGTRKR
ncbi:MAG: NUDIX domain-containing protein [Bryobacteraceae bacterium]|nr:NUDIX domain-containing protein [Bryobacteraceae bacterium]MDW8379874.1 NUDIX domain-containing protein [Bryobacterales bacterium]